MFSGSKKYRLPCADLRQTQPVRAASQWCRFASPEIQSHVARSTKAPGPRVYSNLQHMGSHSRLSWHSLLKDDRKRVVRTQGRCSAALGSHDPHVFVSKARLDKIRLIKLTDTAASGSWLHHVKKKKEVQATPEVDISGKLGQGSQDESRVDWLGALQHQSTCRIATGQYLREPGQWGNAEKMLRRLE